MNSIEDYLSSTKSAATTLIVGIQGYIAILEETGFPFFTSFTIDVSAREKEYEEWREENIDRIEASLAAQDRFVDESFAMASLSGSLLQLAAMGIQKYSGNTSTAHCFEKVIRERTNPAKFCIGRIERGVPIGLIVYAGRNQFNHLNEDELREPNLFIFEQLSKIESYQNKGTFYRDPAFDLQNDIVENYATNITSALGWNNYGAYEKDMLDMLAGSAT
jgi:hypothetical protein